MRTAPLSISDRGGISSLVIKRGELGLDRPGDITPDDHIWVDRQLSWLRIDDGLPRNPRYCPKGGIKEE